MITPINTWVCRCAKCQHKWQTKTEDLPTKCPSCKRVTWNEDYEPEPVEVPVHSPAARPVPVTPTDDRQAKLEALRAMIAPIESAPIAQSAPVESAWKFTSDKPQYADDGNVYRMQYDITNPKRRRTVQVDENDHEKIID